MLTINEMEAAGVEPASEKARREKPTCVSGSNLSAAPNRTGEVSDSLARLSSACGYEQKPSAQACEMTPNG